MIAYLKSLSFANPLVLYALVLIPLFIAWYIWRNKKLYPKLHVSNGNALFQAPKSALTYLRHLPFALKSLALTALILAIARPQSSLKEEKVTTEGIDIVMVMDVSSSMLAQDFSPNRMEASKKLGLEFIDNRNDDRIGLVVFAGESFTQCPITTDHAVVKNFMAEIQQGVLEDGTAIGMGLATAVTRLKDSEAKSKVIILLTDGVNNSGIIDPTTATETAIQYDTRVYTIGVGRRGMARAPVSRDARGRFIYGDVEVEIDEELLKQIAGQTGGKYFRATSNQKLQEIYSEIDQLEKSKIEVTSVKRYAEQFYGFAGFAGLLFLLDFLLRNTIFRSAI